MKRTAGDGSTRDASLDTLLDLDGIVLVIGLTRSRFTGVRTSGWLVLTTHTGCGQSAGPGGKGRTAYDHNHRLRTIGPYEYRDAAALLSDFWAEVDAVLTERGVLP